MAPTSYAEGAFPPDDRLDWRVLLPKITRAHAALARYDALLGTIPGPEVFLSPLTTQEAVLSSRIEGTQATVGDVLGYEASGRSASPTRREDIHEVLNYRSAMRGAVDDLKTLPLCERVIRNAHQVLLSGVRGATKSPGDYRRIPNWIGPPGASIETATYVPISANKLPAAMGRWEEYMNADATDHLVQLAVLHAEFEALHPFLDGNGRLGRMLVPLFLWQRKLIRQPAFHVSAYLEARRAEYYDRLLRVSRDDAWTGWCGFFLDAVAVQADENRRKTLAILDLYERNSQWFTGATRSPAALGGLRWLFAHPIFANSTFARGAGVSSRTTLRWSEMLEARGLVRELAPGNGRRPRIMVFPELLNIVEGRDAF